MANHHALSVKLIEINSLYINENDRNAFSIFFAIKGNFLCKKINEEFVLKEHDFIINNSSESMIFYKQSHQNSLLKLKFYFSEVEKIIGEDWRPYFSDDRLIYINEDEKTILTENIFRLVLDYSEYGIKDQPFATMNRLFSFLEQLNKIVLIEKQSDQMTHFLVSEHPKVMSVIRYVEEFYNRRISLNEIAKREFLSEAYLSRLFKEKTGINFSEYVDSIRLQHAVDELRTSKLPILTIALNNGFSTAKRFSTLFKEKYEMTPNQYRKQAVREENKVIAREEKREDYEVIPEDEMLQIIAQYMLNENIKNESDELPTQYNLSVGSEPSKTLIKPEKIINIGYAEKGISEDVREQIRLLQEKISFEYIRFFGLCEEVANQHHIIMDKFVNNHRLFTFIHEMRLKPIIVLEVKSSTTPETWEKELRNLRKIIQGYVHFEASFKFGWYLEIRLPEDSETSENMMYYHFASKFLKNNFTTGFIGLTVSYKEQDSFKEIYEWSVKHGHQPDFISFNYRDYAVKSKRHETEYMAFIEELDELKIWLEKIESRRVPDIMVTEWNIIASDKQVLTGSFFRSGIVMKSLVQLSTRVRSVGFWLNLESENNVSENKKGSNLSIFLHGSLRRPLFFVLTLFERVGDQIILETDNFLLTKKFNSYYLLFYNYYYLNPADTAYQNLWKTSQREAIFSFSDLKKGKYLVKRFLLDSNHGGIYNQWLKAGGIIEIDTDIQEYLFQSVVPDFQVKEIEIEDGRLEEKTYLEINACYLLIINRIT
jgi:AraC-like DNA-binding protein/beta-xylosidase